MPLGLSPSTGSHRRWSFLILPQTKCGLPRLESRFVEAAHHVSVRDVYSRSTYPCSPWHPTATTGPSIAAPRSWHRSSRPPVSDRCDAPALLSDSVDTLYTPTGGTLCFVLFRGPNADPGSRVPSRKNCRRWALEPNVVRLPRRVSGRYSKSVFLSSLITDASRPSISLAYRSNDPNRAMTSSRDASM